MQKNSQSEDCSYIRESGSLNPEVPTVKKVKWHHFWLWFVVLHSTEVKSVQVILAVSGVPSLVCWEWSAGASMEAMEVVVLVSSSHNPASAALHTYSSHT